MRGEVVSHRFVDGLGNLLVGELERVRINRLHVLHALLFVLFNVRAVLLPIDDVAEFLFHLCGLCLDAVIVDWHDNFLEFAVLVNDVEGKGLCSDGPNDLDALDSAAGKKPLVNLVQHAIALRNHVTHKGRLQLPFIRDERLFHPLEPELVALIEFQGDKGTIFVTAFLSVPVGLLGFFSIGPGAVIRSPIFGLFVLVRFLTHTGQGHLTNDITITEIDAGTNNERFSQPRHRFLVNRNVQHTIRFCYGYSVLGDHRIRDENLVLVIRTQGLDDGGIKRETVLPTIDVLNPL